MANFQTHPISFSDTRAYSSLLQVMILIYMWRCTSSEDRPLMAVDTNRSLDFSSSLAFLIGDFSKILKFDACVLTIQPPSQTTDQCHKIALNLARQAQIVAICDSSEKQGLPAGYPFYGKVVPVVNVLMEDEVSGFDLKTWSNSVLGEYRRDNHVIIVTDTSERADFIAANLKPEVRVNYKFVLVSKVGSEIPNGDVELALEYVYGFAMAEAPLRNEFGRWTQQQGLAIDWDKYTSISDFQGISLRITTLPGNPVVFVDETKTGQVARGYLPDIVLDTLKSRLNFTYRLSTPADKAFGSVDDSGNWSGMVGELQRKEVDIALMSFSLTLARKLVMGFSPAVEYSSTRLILRRDQQSPEFKWKAYSDPFENTVWLLIPTTVVVGAVAMTTLLYCKNAVSTFIKSVWLLAVCFVQQGLDEHSAVRRFPCRVALASFWILAVVLYASYNARLTAFLAAVTTTLPIKSLSEALGSNAWAVGMVKGSSVPDRVKTSKMPEMVHLWKKVSNDPSVFVTNFAEGINRAYTERYIFFTSEIIPQYLVKDNCSFAWIPGKYFSGFGYMGYQKDLPFANTLSHEISRVRESGQMKRLYKKWWGSGSGCSGESKSGEYPGMSLYETGTAFLLLGAGSVVAMAILLGEKIFTLTPYSEQKKVKFKEETRSSRRSSSVTAEAIGSSASNSSSEYIAWPPDKNILVASYEKTPYVYL